MATTMEQRRADRQVILPDTSLGGLVKFDPLPQEIPYGKDIQISYTVNEKFWPKLTDWIGLFKAEAETPNTYSLVSFRWAPVRPNYTPVVGRPSGSLRFVIFSFEHDFMRHQPVLSSSCYKFFYMHATDSVVSQSDCLRVAPATSATTTTSANFITAASSLADHSAPSQDVDHRLSPPYLRAVLRSTNVENHESWPNIHAPGQILFRTQVPSSDVVLAYEDRIINDKVAFILGAKPENCTSLEFRKTSTKSSNGSQKQEKNNPREKRNEEKDLVAGSVDQEQGGRKFRDDKNVEGEEGGEDEYLDCVSNQYSLDPKSLIAHYDFESIGPFSSNVESHRNYERIESDNEETITVKEFLQTSADNESLKLLGADADTKRDFSSLPGAQSEEVSMSEDEIMDPINRSLIMLGKISVTEISDPRQSQLSAKASAKSSHETVNSPVQLKQLLKIFDASLQAAQTNSINKPSSDHPSKQLSESKRIPDYSRANPLLEFYSKRLLQNTSYTCPAASCSTQLADVSTSSSTINSKPVCYSNVPKSAALIIPVTNCEASEINATKHDAQSQTTPPEQPSEGGSLFSIVARNLAQMSRNRFNESTLSNSAALSCPGTPDSKRPALADIQQREPKQSETQQMVPVNQNRLEPDSLDSQKRLEPDYKDAQAAPSFTTFIQPQIQRFNQEFELLQEREPIVNDSSKVRQGPQAKAAEGPSACPFQSLVNDREKLKGLIDAGTRLMRNGDTAHRAIDLVRSMVDKAESKGQGQRSRDENDLQNTSQCQHTVALQTLKLDLRAVIQNHQKLEEDFQYLRRVLLQIVRTHNLLPPAGHGISFLADQKSSQAHGSDAVATEYLLDGNDESPLRQTRASQYQSRPERGVWYDDVCFTVKQAPSSNGAVCSERPHSDLRTEISNLISADSKESNDSSSQSTFCEGVTECDELENFRASANSVSSRHDVVKVASDKALVADSPTSDEDEVYAVDRSGTELSSQLFRFPFTPVLDMDQLLAGELAEEGGDLGEMEEREMFLLTDVRNGGSWQKPKGALRSKKMPRWASGGKRNDADSELHSKDDHHSRKKERNLKKKDKRRTSATPKRDNDRKLIKIYQQEKQEMSQNKTESPKAQSTDLIENEKKKQVEDSWRDRKIQYSRKSGPRTKDLKNKPETKDATDQGSTSGQNKNVVNRGKKGKSKNICDNTIQSEGNDRNRESDRVIVNSKFVSPRGDRENERQQTESTSNKNQTKPGSALNETQKLVTELVDQFMSYLNQDESKKPAHAKARTRKAPNPFKERLREKKLNESPSICGRRACLPDSDHTAKYPDPTAFLIKLAGPTVANADDTADLISKDVDEVRNTRVAGKNKIETDSGVNRVTKTKTRYGNNEELFEMPETPNSIVVRDKATGVDKDRAVSDNKFVKMFDDQVKNYLYWKNMRRNSWKCNKENQPDDDTNKSTDCVRSNYKYGSMFGLTKRRRQREKKAPRTVLTRLAKQLESEVKEMKFEIMDIPFDTEKFSSVKQESESDRSEDVSANSFKEPSEASFVNSDDEKEIWHHALAQQRENEMQENDFVYASDSALPSPTSPITKDGKLNDPNSTSMSMASPRQTNEKDVDTSYMMNHMARKTLDDLESSRITQTKYLVSQEPNENDLADLNQKVSRISSGSYTVYSFAGIFDEKECEAVKLETENNQDSAQNIADDFNERKRFGSYRKTSRKASNSRDGKQSRRRSRTADKKSSADLALKTLFEPPQISDIPITGRRESRGRKGKQSEMQRYPRKESIGSKSRERKNHERKQKRAEKHEASVGIDENMSHNGRKLRAPVSRSKSPKHQADPDALD